MTDHSCLNLIMVMPTIYDDGDDYGCDDVDVDGDKDDVDE